MSTLNCPPDPSTTGAYQITWTGSSLPATLVETGPAGESKVLLENSADASTAISGRGAGVYTYTLHQAGRLDSTCVVRVEPPSTALALTLFVIGLGVAIATCVSIIAGHRRRDALTP